MFAKIFDEKILVKRSNIFSSEDWVAENLIFLANDSRESSFGVEKQVVGEKVGDSSPKVDDTKVGEFLQSLNKEDMVDDNEFPLRWSL